LAINGEANGTEWQRVGEKGKNALFNPKTQRGGLKTDVWGKKTCKCKIIK